MQRLARRTGSRDGSIDAKKYFAVQARRFGLHAKYDILRNHWTIVRGLWHFTAALAGATGCHLSDDRAGVALGGAGKLFGKQEI